MIKNKDILADVAALKKPPYCVGFAAETNNVIEYARKKLEKKKLQLVAANQVGNEDTGFKTKNNAITLISKDHVIELPKQNKFALARNLIAAITDHFQKTQ